MRPVGSPEVSRTRPTIRWNVSRASVWMVSDVERVEPPDVVGVGEGVEEAVHAGGAERGDARIALIRAAPGLGA